MGELIYWAITPVVYDYYLGREEDKARYEAKMDCSYTDKERRERILEIDKYFLKMRDKSSIKRLIP